MDEALKDDLAELVAKEAEAAGVPGVAVGVLLGDERLFVGHGVTNVEHPLPVDSSTLFQIGSATKPVTASCVLRLIEDGRLGLDDRVTDVLPGGFAFPDVTVRHLLTHTAGFSGDWFLLTSPDYGRDGALARVVEDIHNSPVLLPPGEAFAYNNAGFYVLGRIVEVVTGLPYPSAVRSMVLDPVGMDHSFFWADEMVTHRVAAGHKVDGSVFRPWPRPFFAWPAGALCSCVDDLLTWASVWCEPSEAIDGFLSPATMGRMTTPEIAADNGLSVGLSWMLYDVGGHKVVEHGGSTNGYLTKFSIVPAERFAVTVLSNSSGAAALNRVVERWVYERVLGVSDRDPSPLEDVDAAALEQYAGRYGLSADAGWAHTMRVDGTELVLTPGSPGSEGSPPYRLALHDVDAFVTTAPEGAAGLCGSFGRSASTGEVAWMRFGLRIYVKLDG